MAYQVPPTPPIWRWCIAHCALAKTADPYALNIDWVGTSMGGLIGMALAAQPAHRAAPSGAQRCGAGDPVGGPAAHRHLPGPIRCSPPSRPPPTTWRGISSGFGPHTPEQWLALSRPMLRERSGRLVAALRPGHRRAVRPCWADRQPARPRQKPCSRRSRCGRCTTPSAAHPAAAWGRSDLLTRDTALAMTRPRGPRRACVEFAGVGHAPTLVAADQVAACAAIFAGRLNRLPNALPVARRLRRSPQPIAIGHRGGHRRQPAARGPGPGPCARFCRAAAGLAKARHRRKHPGPCRCGGRHPARHRRLRGHAGLRVPGLRLPAPEPAARGDHQGLWRNFAALAMETTKLVQLQRQARLKAAEVQAKKAARRRRTALPRRLPGQGPVSELAPARPRTCARCCWRSRATCGW
jgi:hypothetical protein